MSEEAFYEEVARELATKPMVPGLWTKAFADAGGSLDQAQALYIRYRVAQLAEAATRQQQEQARLRITRSFAHQLGVTICVLLTAFFGFVGITLLASSKPGQIGGGIAALFFAIAFGFITFAAVVIYRRRL